MGTCAKRAHEVKNSVDECSVKRHEKDDELLEQKHKGSSDGSLHLGSERSGEHRVKVELRAVDFASFLLKLGGTSTEKNRSIRLRAVECRKVSEGSIRDERWWVKGEKDDWKKVTTHLRKPRQNMMNEKMTST